MRKYICTCCGAEGVKLWREYNSFADHTPLLCYICAQFHEKDEVETPIRVDETGRHRDEEFGYRTDQIGWLVPAVPADDGETFWGYTSVPEAEVKWWRSLPNEN